MSMDIIFLQKIEKMFEKRVGASKGRVSPANPAQGRLGPLKQSNPGVQTAHMDILTLHFVPQGHGGGYDFRRILHYFRMICHDLIIIIL